LRGAGDIRRLKMYNGRAGESMDMIYWIEGDYIAPLWKKSLLHARLAHGPDPHRDRHAHHRYYDGGA
jgi:hypothetical protein